LPFQADGRKFSRGRQIISPYHSPDKVHILSGLDWFFTGIPSVVSWSKEDFIYAMYEYMQRIRPNLVMQTVSGRLGDEELAVLATYSGAIKEH